MATATTTRDRTSMPPGASAEDRRYIDEHRDGMTQSALRAKWVHRPGEKPDRSGQTLATRDHDVIRDWAERRNAIPATATRTRGGEPRTLRFDFLGDDGGGRNDRLEEVPWEEVFRIFDERDLVFLFQETRRDGSQSNFWRLLNPNREDA
jgi:hypothetical protein